MVRRVDSTPPPTGFLTTPSRPRCFARDLRPLPYCCTLRITCFPSPSGSGGGTQTFIRDPYERFAPLTTDHFSFFGFHSLANFCASVIWFRDCRTRHKQGDDQDHGGGRSSHLPPHRRGLHSPRVYNAGYDREGSGKGGTSWGGACPPGEELSRYIPVSIPCGHHNTHKCKNEHPGCRIYGRYQRLNYDGGRMSTEGY